MTPTQQDTRQETGPHQQPFPAHPLRLDTLTASETAKHRKELGVWLRWLTGRYALDHRAIP
ncbi:MAG: hypothetical protein ABI251_05445, partial [Mycobacteriaceae bacterium]